METINVTKLRRLQEASALIVQYAGDIARDKEATTLIVSLGIIQENARNIVVKSQAVLNVVEPVLLQVKEKEVAQATDIITQLQAKINILEEEANAGSNSNGDDGDDGASGTDADII
jgi:hypothetical protein